MSIDRSRFDEVWVEMPDGQAMCALINGDLGWLMYLRDLPSPQWHRDVLEVREARLRLMPQILLGKCYNRFRRSRHEEGSEYPHKGDK